MLPTDVETAFNFYKDVDRILPYLPRIEHVQTHAPSHLRVCYLSRELNAYDVRIFCDIQAETDPENHVIRLLPQETSDPVKASSGFHTTIAHGRYSSESYFYPEGDQTRLEYWIELAAELPKPWAVRLVPDSVMSSIATSIATYRIQEIANGFIERSAAAMVTWQEERL